MRAASLATPAARTHDHFPIIDMIKRMDEAMVACVYNMSQGQ